MSYSKPSQQTIEVFSALQFYSECAAGVAKPSGIQSTQLEIPASGLQLVERSSLRWIDGFFADYDACEQLVSAVERRLLPTPLLSHAAHTLDNHCVYTSVEALASSSESIISAFGVVAHIAEKALESSAIDCPRCKQTTSRVLTPLAFSNALLQEWGSQEVVIGASSADARFPEWAATMGFSLKHGAIHELPYVTIDSNNCAPAFIASLGTVLRSVWTIPQIILMCTSGSTTRVYSPYGWCSACNSLISKPERTQLTKLLSSGLRDPHLSSDDFVVERSLSIESKLRIEEILTTPLHELQTGQNTILRELRSILVALELGSYPLSFAVKNLPAEHVALLSIALSLHRAKHDRSTILIDLPTGILRHRHQCVRAVSVCDQYASHTFALLGDPFQTSQYSQSRSTDVSEAAHSTSITTPTNDSPLLLTIPLFPGRPSNNRILADELELIQGIAQLYAASTDARCVGLVAKDFTFSSSRSQRYLCRGCKGLGVQLSAHPQLCRPLARPCTLCLGARFKEPVASTLFRGVSYATLMNRSLKEALDTLRALPRSRDLVESVKLLDLEHLPLGMPVAILSSSELRRVLLVKGVLAARNGRVKTIVIEAPDIGLTDAHRDGIQALKALPSMVNTCQILEA